MEAIVIVGILISVCIVLDETVFKPKRKKSWTQKSSPFSKESNWNGSDILPYERRCFSQKQNMVSGSA